MKKIGASIMDKRSYLQLQQEFAGSPEDSRCYWFPATTLADAPARMPTVSAWQHEKRTPPRHPCVKSPEDPPLQASAAAALPSSCSESSITILYNNPPFTVHDIRPSFKERIAPPRGVSEPRTLIFSFIIITATNNNTRCSVDCSNKPSHRHCSSSTISKNHPFPWSMNPQQPSEICSNNSDVGSCNTSDA